VAPKSLLVGVVPELHGDFSLNGTQFTYFTSTSTNVQKVAQKALLVADSCVERLRQ
jgi:ABC-type transport system involved in cytochrome bd biosynthesis fused ATPase/permease subunit